MSYVLTTIAPRTYSASGDFFGYVIKRNPTNDKLIVSAPTSNSTGRVWIFNYSAPNTFTFSTKLDSTGRAALDLFGASLEAYQNRYYVGMPGKNCVQVFDTPSAPADTQNYTLTAPNYVADYNDYNSTFGNSLGLVSNNLLVGVDGESTVYANGGAVYSFFLTGGSINYGFKERIVPPSNGPGDGFGASIAIDGTNMVVGAPYRDQGANTNAGAVYYFTFNSATSAWTYQQAINNPAPANDGFFGKSLAIKDNNLVVGAPGNTGTGGSLRNVTINGDGVVYYYKLVGSTWTYNSTLTCFDLDTSPKELGTSVALSSNNAPSPSYAVVAGAPKLAADFLGINRSPGGVAVFSNINNNVYNSVLCRNYLSATYVRDGYAINADYPDYVLAGAPLLANGVPGGTAPGAVLIHADVFTPQPFPKPVISEVIPSYRIEYSGLPIAEFDIVASNGPTGYSMSPAIAGITIDPNTGRVSGTRSGTGNFNTNFYATNIGGISDPLPITFSFIAAPTNPIIQNNQAVSIGNTAGNTQSVNVVMNLAFNTLNSSLGTRESEWMNQYTTYGVCMPGQVHKNDLWKPTGPGGTYRPSGLNEFRTGYRWTQITTGNAILININKNIQRGNGLTPGLDLGTAIITATGNGSPIYTGGGTPYSFYLYGQNMPAGPVVVRRPASGWTTAGGAGASVTWGSLYATDGSGTYTIYIKDHLGCGTLDDRINVVATFNYP
jgi:hypothetical protein